MVVVVVVVVVAAAAVGARHYVLLKTSIWTIGWEQGRGGWGVVACQQTSVGGQKLIIRLTG